MRTIDALRTLSALIALLICWSSLEGLYMPEIYAHETALRTAQIMGQDTINLGVVPFYVFTVLLLDVRKGQLNALWMGTTIYFIYVFLIYCLEVGFNRLFLLYLLILGLLIYSLFACLFARWRVLPAYQTDGWLRSLTAGYFLFTGVIFSIAWLSEIIPEFDSESAATNLLNRKTSTNSLHVVDLAIMLPGVMLAGLLLLRRKTLGYFLAPVILTFSLLMNLGLALLAVILSSQGHEQDSGFELFMFSMTGASLLLLIGNMKHAIV